MSLFAGGLQHCSACVQQPACRPHTRRRSRRRRQAKTVTACLVPCRRYAPHHDVLVSSSWGAPSEIFKGFDPSKVPTHCESRCICMNSSAGARRRRPCPRRHDTSPSGPPMLSLPFADGDQLFFWSWKDRTLQQTVRGGGWRVLRGACQGGAMCAARRLTPACRPTACCLPTGQPGPRWPHSPGGPLPARPLAGESGGWLGGWATLPELLFATCHC